VSFRPPRAEALEIAGPAGRLEALLEQPEDGNSQECAVVCHPHPQHGGTMHNKVVHTLARALQGLSFTTVRFNYRGVGASAGSYGEGVGETDDALAVIAEVRRRWPQASLTLCGFSFGGSIALRAGALQLPQRLITVAPAVDRLTVPAAAPRCPWLLVQGEADDVVEAQRVREWLRTLAVQPRVVFLPGVGHFFHGALPQLKTAVEDFIAGR
jgi:alpha/beta superfamily hydrolase